MKDRFLLILIITLVSCNTQNQLEHKNTKQIENKYDNVFLLGDCIDPLLFSRNDAIHAWQFTGRDWQFAVLNINSFNEINDSLLTRSRFKSNYLYNYDENPKNYKIEIGDFFIAKNKARVNVRYVLKFLDRKEDKVKLEYDSYFIKNDLFYKLDNKDKLKHLILNSDVKTLEELMFRYGGNINVCESFTDINTTPLTFAMEKNKKEVFNKLLELGANINQGCRGNRTTLMYASRLSDTYYFQKLIELGADCSAQDENGKTIHDYIVYYKKDNLLKYID